MKTSEKISRPNENPPHTVAVAEPVRRRSFIGWLWGGFGLAVLAEAVWVVGAFLKPRRQRPHDGGIDTLIVAGPVDGFVHQTVTAFPRGRFYLARLNDGGFLALSRECTHLGCTVPWEEKDQVFRCPCHASKFDIRGAAIHAPATRPLDLFKVKIENNTVSVDTGRRMRRSVFKDDQVVYSSGEPEKPS